MRLILLFILILIDSFVFSQDKIVGRVFDYEKNSPVFGCLVYLDTTVSDFNSQKFVTTNDSGFFQLDLKDKIKNLVLGFQFVGFEKMVIKNIQRQPNTFDLGAIWLFDASLTWDGICTKKYLFGLIKIKKGCWGNVVGIVDKNKGKSNFTIEYPKNGSVKRFDIFKHNVILDYNELKK
jgi:hypothetical protein